MHVVLGMLQIQRRVSSNVSLMRAVFFRRCIFGSSETENACRHHTMHASRNYYRMGAGGWHGFANCIARSHGNLNLGSFETRVLEGRKTRRTTLRSV